MFFLKNKKTFFFFGQLIIWLAIMIFFSPALKAADKSQPQWTIPSPEIKISNKIHFSEPQVCGSKNGSPIYCLPWLGQYLQTVYNWGIGAVGIVAALAIVIGGLIWLTAGGNMSRVSEAKTWIASALLGLVLALGAYSILYQINPQLVIFKPLRILAPKGTALPQPTRYYNCSWQTACAGSTRLAKDELCGPTDDSGGLVPEFCCCDINAKPNCAWQATDCSGSFIKFTGEDAFNNCGTIQNGGAYCCCLSGNNTCALYSTDDNGVINFNTARPTSLPASCQRYNFNGYNVSGKILAAIAAAETGCNAQAQSAAGACGLMQLLPGTAGKSCEYLKDNPQESIKIAADYIARNAQYHNNEPIKIFAGYNSGYQPNANSGKKAALAPSSDCAGRLAFECCLNPGGLAETQEYVMRAYGYYLGQ